MSNITSEVAEELKVEFGEKYKEKLLSLPDIQLYANHFIFQYQWRDLNVKKLENPIDNESFDTRGELKAFIKKYLEKFM